MICQKGGTKISSEQISENSDDNPNNTVSESQQPLIQKNNFNWTKKKIIISIVGILLLLSVVLFIFIPRPEKDFRQATWGMTQSEVMKAEKLSLLSNDNDSLIYDGEKFGGYDEFGVQVAYTFDNNGKLTNGMYMDNSEVTKNESLDGAKYTYQAFMNILTKQYGKSKQSDSINSDGQKIGAGTVFTTKWNRKNTTVILTLTNVANKNSLFVSYTPKDQS